jgi:hypothetical protein
VPDSKASARMFFAAPGAIRSRSASSIAGSLVPGAVVG